MALSGMTGMQELYLVGNKVIGSFWLCFVYRCFLLGLSTEALRVTMVASCLLCVSRRQPRGFVGHDGHSKLGFGWEPGDRCVSVGFVYHFISCYDLPIEASSVVPALRSVW
jgi:hypothetical protein